MEEPLIIIKFITNRKYIIKKKYRGLIRKLLKTSFIGQIEFFIIFASKYNRKNIKLS